MLARAESFRLARERHFTVMNAINQLSADINRRAHRSKRGKTSFHASCQFRKKQRQTPKENGDLDRFIQNHEIERAAGIVTIPAPVPTQPLFDPQSDESELDEFDRNLATLSTPDDVLVAITAQVAQDLSFLESYQTELDAIRVKQAQLKVSVSDPLSLNSLAGSVMKASMAAIVVTKIAKESIDAGKHGLSALKKAGTLADRFVPSSSTSAIIASTLVSSGVSIAGLGTAASLTVAPFTGPLAPIVAITGAATSIVGGGIVSGSGILAGGLSLGYNLMKTTASITTDVIGLTADVTQAGLMTVTLGAGFLKFVSSLPPDQSELAAALLTQRANEIQRLARNSFEERVRLRQLEWNMRGNRLLTQT